MIYYFYITAKLITGGFALRKPTTVLRILCIRMDTSATTTAMMVSRIPTAAGSPWVDDFSVACSIDHLGETKGYKDYGNNSYGTVSLLVLVAMTKLQYHI